MRYVEHLRFFFPSLAAGIRSFRSQFHHHRLAQKEETPRQDEMHCNGILNSQGSKGNEDKKSHHKMIVYVSTAVRVLHFTHFTRKYLHRSALENSKRKLGNFLLTFLLLPHPHRVSLRAEDKKKSN